MSPKAKRRRFVLVMTAFGTAYGSILAFRLLGHQADVLSDVLKLSIIILFGLLALSSFWWTLIMRRTNTSIRGAIAAFLTAICIIPIPTFIGGFKSHFSMNHEFADAAILAFKYSISTFSLAEFIALPLCAITGYFLAK